MRAFVFVMAVMAAFTVAAQDPPAPKKKPATKAAPKKVQAAHKKPTPDQIRKFNDLEKKQKKD